MNAAAPNFASPSREAGLRLLCFLGSATSGATLLAKLYGLAPMHWLAAGLVVPSCLVLAILWLWMRNTAFDGIARDLQAGAMGGLLGSFGYDLFRIPFHLAGMHVFSPISAFGVWCLDSELSSRFSEVAGWAYHFSNGITFGMMYALAMRGRHWGWAVVWALLLELIAVISPFGSIFSLRGNSPGLSVAFAAHVPYGLLLGFVISRRDPLCDWLNRLSWPVTLGAAVLAVAGLLGPLISPEEAARDARARPGEFRVEGIRLNPSWLRIERGQSIEIFNPENAGVEIVLKKERQSLEIAARGRTRMALELPGVSQVFVNTQRRSRSSFVIVEPVQDAGP